MENVALKENFDSNVVENSDSSHQVLCTLDGPTYQSLTNLCLGLGLDEKEAVAVAIKNFLNIKTC